ncbi:MAG: twin-arginine translocation signal domain-containing protein, partial [Gammaproteobacteria bacterium]|nr:twin-arginine translocation signal domain-containing protein [Gammaproteobacteria bacterium]
MSRILLPHNKRVSLSRRRFVQGLTAGGALLAAGISTKPAHAKKLANYSEQYVLRGNRFDLTHRSVRVNFTGKE